MYIVFIDVKRILSPFIKEGALLKLSKLIIIYMTTYVVKFIFNSYEMWEIVVGINLFPYAFGNIFVQTFLRFIILTGAMVTPYISIYHQFAPLITLNKIETKSFKSMLKLSGTQLKCGDKRILWIMH